MVRLTVVLKASNREATRLLDAFRYVMVRTRLETGCADCSAWADADGVVHYMEEWASEADMRRRVASEQFVNVLAVIESGELPPRVQFDFVSSTRGLDYILEVRESPNGASSKNG